MACRLFHILLLLIPLTNSIAQQTNIGQLRHAVENSQNDTTKLIYLKEMAQKYVDTKQDSTIYYAEQLLKLAHKLNFKLTEAEALTRIGYAYLEMGNYPRSLQTLLAALALAEEPKSEQNILPVQYLDTSGYIKHPITAHIIRLEQLSFTHHCLGILYGNTYNHAKERWHYFEALNFTESSGHIPSLCEVNNTLGRFYLSLKKPDSALIYENKAYELSVQSGFNTDLGSIIINLGRIQYDMGNIQQAKEYFKKAIDVSAKENYLRGVVAGNLRLSALYKQSGKPDSTLNYANRALLMAQSLNYPDLLLRSYSALAAFYKSGNNNDSLAKYQGLIIAINDSLFNSSQVQLFKNIDFDEQQRQQEIESARKEYRNRMQVYVLITGLAIFLLLALHLWRNNQHRKKSNSILQKQKGELEVALKNLKSTQAQLIQSEKMASLGELTAGIAHEIQNPLNFVNNFSETNVELLEELKQEIIADNKTEAMALANDAIKNNVKINQHGKRADTIVKGMMQHARTNTGEKQPTGINALTNEYLRLAYHGFKFKGKSFNGTLEIHFDESIGNVNIVPQDIGRVLLNLFNNAFYAVQEKKNKADTEYEPIVSVSTKKQNNDIQIVVQDNGTGIPQQVLDKVFQPFFTTKPTGEGTGLGLSLSYDIVKAHGGNINMESIEGQGTTFSIQLPLY